MASRMFPMVRTGALTRADSRRVALFAKTKGKDLVGPELDEALEMCEVYGANGLTNDIYFFCFGKYGEDNRKVVPVLSIGMYRKIAARSGNYRPDSSPPRFTYDEKAIGPDNPKGIVDCEVTVYRFAHNEWFPTPSRLKWGERAPLIEHCEAGYKYEETGDTWPNGKPKKKKIAKGPITVVLDPKKENWHKMPETMLAKCCEADAIRKGWPNETAGSYGEGELDAVETIELTATEIIEKEERQDRLSKIGGINTLPIDWLDGSDLVAVPVGKFFDKAMEFVISHSKPGEEEYSTIAEWRKRNRLGLQQFWGMEKDAALELRKKLDEVAEKAASTT